MIHCLICKKAEGESEEPLSQQKQRKNKSPTSLEQGHSEMIKNLEDEMSMSRDSSENIEIQNGPEISERKVGIEDFKIIRMLGRGSFGKVLLVEKKESSTIDINN